MKIKKTTEQDFMRIMEIYAFAREYMKAHGNPNQWGPTNWPPEELIHNDIKEGKSYVCLKEFVLSVLTGLFPNAELLSRRPSFWNRRSHRFYIAPHSFFYKFNNFISNIIIFMLNPVEYFTF